MAGKSILISVGIVLMIIAGAIGYQLNQPEEQTLKGVNIANEYHATTTKDSTAVVPVIKAEGGALGSVITTITGTATLDLYDATTTNANLRTGQVATSSLPLLAHFGASPTVGTYTFDQAFYNGLVAVWGSGTISSTTITYR